MTMHSWLALAGTIGLVVASPGPSVALVWATRVRCGARAVPPTVAGDLSANMLQLAIAWIGLSRLHAMGVAGQTLAWLGTGYLAWLGVQRISGAVAVVSGSGSDLVLAGTGPAALFTRGFLVSAANPKAILFFMSLLPASLAGQQVGLGQLLLVAVTFVAMDGTALVLYAFGGNQLRQSLVHRGRGHWEGWITGGLLLAAAGLLAWRAGH